MRSLSHSPSSWRSRASCADVFRAYVLAGREQLELRLAEIPSDFEDMPRPEIFNPEKMERLFQAGFDLAR